MRICVLTSPFGDLPPNSVGAVEKLYHQLAIEWVGRRHDVCFVCSGGGDSPRVQYVRVGRSKRTGRTITDLPIDLWYSVKALLAAPKCDILLCNTFWSPVVAPLLRWKYKRLIYGVHRHPKNQFWLYPFVHKFVCVSNVVADALRKQSGLKKSIDVIHNPVDTRIFRPLARERSCHKTFSVVYSGRVHPEKGLHLLFKAVELLAVRPDSIVKTIKVIGPMGIDKGGGGDAYVNQLKSFAPHVSICWVGEVRDQEILAREMSSGDCFVYPSVSEKGESFGVAPLEAMSLGLPTVVSDLECFRDFLQDGVNGFSFEHRAVDAVERLAAKIDRLSSNEDERRAVGERAAKTAREFSVERIAGQYLDVFQKTMAKR